MMMTVFIFLKACLITRGFMAMNLGRTKGTLITGEAS